MLLARTVIKEHQIGTSAKEGQNDSEHEAKIHPKVIEIRVEIALEGSSS